MADVARGILRATLPTFVLATTLLTLSGCSTPSSRIPEADQQVERLVQAIERNDTQGARALLLHSESDLWEPALSRCIGSDPLLRQDNAVNATS